MQVIETITLRAVGIHRAELLAFLESRITTFQFPEHLEAVECHTHADVESDINLHLIWNTPPEKRKKSPLCIFLEDALKEFGLIDSNTWTRRFGLTKPSTPTRALNTETPS